MKIAVTGGTGFIGAAAVSSANAKGHEVWTFDRTDGHNIMGDLRHLEGAEAVVHLAGHLGTAELFQSVDEAVQVNVVGATRIMQWCADHNASYVGILMPDVFPSLYTATKVGSYRISESLRHAGLLRCAHVRAFNAYGPGQKFGAGHPQKIVPTFAVKAWRREPLPIWGTGHQWVDLVHVDDVGRMLIDTAELLHNWYQEGFTPFAHPVLDAGSGVSMSVYEVAMAVAKYAGWNANDVEIDYLPMRAGEIETEIRATGEGWDLLDWRPRHDLELLRATVEHYKQYA